MAKTNPARRKAAKAIVRAEVDAAFEEIVKRTDAFCAAHLDEEYAELSRMLAENLRVEPISPLLKGRPEGWAAGIVYTVGKVNFLSDPSQTPHMKTADFYKKFHVSEATVQARAADIRRLYDLQGFDPRLSRRSMIDRNPMVWMIELQGGLIDDARRYPREVQEQLVERGLIPHVHPSAVPGSGWVEDDEDEDVADGEGTASADDDKPRS